MHETRRTGVRFVLANPSDPGRLDDFSDWYDTYAAALTVPVYLADAFRFENPDASATRRRLVLLRDAAHRGVCAVWRG